MQKQNQALKNKGFHKNKKGGENMGIFILSLLLLAILGVQSFAELKRLKEEDEKKKKQKEVDNIKT